MFKRIAEYFSDLPPPKSLVLGYLTYALLGWLVLLIPICHKEHVSALDNFFIALSAMSGTGLATVSVVNEYSLWGQIVILLLIQAGGIGYMTFSSFVILATTKKLSHFRSKIASTAFSLPEGFSVQEFIYNVATFTFVCELIGAVVLGLIFLSKGVEFPIWYGIFHSISAFCTAGFSLFQDSFIQFKYDVGINITISVLSILGAMGFIVWLDLYKRIKGNKDHLTFITKVILSVTFWFLVLGTLLFFLLEGPLQENTTFHRLITSFFQIMTANTTVGYNTLDIGNLTRSTVILLIFFMVFGSSPSGTGGGLKSTTFVALVGLVKSTITNHHTVSFWKREIPPKRVQLATAIFGYYMFVLSISVFILTISESSKSFLPILFEAASALGTVGLSMGLTSDLSSFGKVLIALLMLMGRVGILTFGIALSVKRKEVDHYEKDNELVF
jgi:trk system potassium uptake protein